jgi:hypothetical protein
MLRKPAGSPTLRHTRYICAINQVVVVFGDAVVAGSGGRVKGLCCTGGSGAFGTPGLTHSAAGLPCPRCASALNQVGLDATSQVFCCWDIACCIVHLRPDCCSPVEPDWRLAHQVSGRLCSARRGRLALKADHERHEANSKSSNAFGCATNFTRGKVRY